MEERSIEKNESVQKGKDLQAAKWELRKKTGGGQLRHTINRSYSWKDGEKWRETVMEGITAVIFPGNIFADMRKINLSIMGDLKTWTLEPDFGLIMVHHLLSEIFSR